jgi:hypothetical protein
VAQYNKDIPKRRIADEKEPNIKYFKPASTEKEEFLLKDAIT